MRPYLGNCSDQWATSAGTPVNNGPHNNGGYNVGYADGHVKFGQGAYLLANVASFPTDTGYSSAP